MEFFGDLFLQKNWKSTYMKKASFFWESFEGMKPIWSELFVNLLLSVHNHSIASYNRSLAFQNL